jgi:phosphate transport system substrate-binding protein
MTKRSRFRMSLATCLAGVAALLLVVDTDGVGIAADLVTLHGSSNTHKSVVEPGKDACQKATGVSIDIVGSSAGAGLEDLIKGKCDIAMSADTIPEVLSGLKGVSDPGNLKEFVVGKTRMVVAVHKENPVTKLSADQLKGLLTGTIGNWKDVGGEDKPVVVIAAPQGSANRKVVQRQLMGGGEFAGGTIDAETAAKQAEYLSVNPEGIIVVGESTLKTAKGGTAKVVEAPEAALQMTLVTKGEPTGSVKKIVDFYMGSVGK